MEGKEQENRIKAETIGKEGFGVKGGTSETSRTKERKV